MVVGICSRRRFIQPPLPAMPVPPSPTSPADDDRNLVAVGETNVVTFGDKLHTFWEKNGKAVLAFCGLVILGVLAKGLWEYMARQRELGVEQAYAAATTPEQLKTFAAAHPDHSLGAIAQLRMADEAYTAGKFAEAISGYDQALGVLKTGPLAARVQLGRAMARIMSGKTAEGTADLKQLLEDANQLKAIRVEAGYHLASLAAEARNSEEVQKLSDRLIQIDPSSLWSQRALTLRANLAVPTAPAASAPATKQGETTPGVQLKLPGK
jgi:hypothetical protein